MYLQPMIFAQSDLFCPPMIDLSQIEEEYNTIESISANLSDIIYTKAMKPSFIIGQKIYQRKQIRNKQEFDHFNKNCTQSEGEEYSPTGALPLSNVLSHFKTDEQIIFSVSEIDNKLFASGGFETSSIKDGKSNFLGYKIKNATLKSHEYSNTENFGGKSFALCRYSLPPSDSFLTQLNLAKLNLVKEKTDLSTLVTDILNSSNITFTLANNNLKINHSVDAECIKVGLEIFRITPTSVPRFVNAKNKDRILQIFKDVTHNIKAAKDYLLAFKREGRLYQIKTKLTSFYDFIVNMEWDSYCGTSILFFIISTIVFMICVTSSYFCLGRGIRKYMAYLQDNIFTEVPQDDVEMSNMNNRT